MADVKDVKEDQAEEMETDTQITCTLEGFKEVEEVVKIIESIGSICHQEILLEAAAERLLGTELAHIIIRTQQKYESEI